MGKITTIIDNFLLPNNCHFFHKVSEYGRGRIAGKALNNKDVQEAKDVIMHETLACNFDFLRGLNETLNKDLAKKAYGLIGQ